MDKGRRQAPVNCHKCGRFLGPDGDPDVAYDPYMGAYEAGYPTCGPCLEKLREAMEDQP